MRKISMLCLFYLVPALPLLAAVSSYAGEVMERPDGTTIWRAGIDGVEIAFNPDGRWHRIYSQHAHPVAFPDRQGIAKAYIIAEEKAKLNILRFLEQKISGGRVITEIQNDLSESRLKQQGTMPGAVSKLKRRQIIENLSEITASTVSGQLRGVIILERGYDEPREEVWVRVGISRKTIGAAGSLRDTLSGSERHNPSTQGDGRAQHRSPGSEVQRLKNDNW